MRDSRAHTHADSLAEAFDERKNQGTWKQSTEASFRPDHRRAIRHHELMISLPFLKSGKRILEVGAGAGWQAKTLSNLGHDVTAIDIPSSNYVALREWPVTDYDGTHIPAPARSFDAIFSSNVLEHVTDLNALLNDMSRVLKNEGVAIHIMPSASWRLWTSLGFYIRRISQILGNDGRGGNQTDRPAQTTQRPPISRLRNILFPATHGVRGNWLTELYFFSEYSWRRRIGKSGWEVAAVVPNRLFYSGAKIFGDRLSLQLRNSLSKTLGSSCKIYVLKKKPSFLRS